jgi:hypothetical protein
VRYEAHKREKRNSYRAATDHLEEQGIPWRIVLK